MCDRDRPGTIKTFAGALRSCDRSERPKSKTTRRHVAAEQAWDGTSPAARHMVETELTGQPESVFAIRLIGQVLEQKGEFGAAARMYAANPSLKGEGPVVPPRRPRPAQGREYPCEL